MQEVSELIKASISLLSALIWPAIVVWLVLSFRSQISGLIDRLASLKVAGNEFIFQQPSPKSLSVETVPKSAIVPGPDGFLSVPSLREIIRESGLTGADGSVVGELMLFQTPAQRTWLLATIRRIFIVLDDEGTRRTRDLIQTSFERDRALPLQFDASRGADVVRFAAENIWWYYSRHLFPTTDLLTEAVRRLCEMR